MDQGREVSSFSRTGARACYVVALLMAGIFAQAAYAEGGETQVTKTTPSTPPAPAPVAPAPATPPSASAAAKPASPVGGGAKWQGKTTQPSQAAPAAPPQPVDESEQEIVAKVNDYFNKLTNLEGTFLQTDPDNKQKQGVFYFAKPGRLRFDYAAPSRLKIISNGYYLAIEDYALSTSDKYPLEMTPFRLLLSETVDLAKDANILGIDQGPDTVIITVEDKKGDAAGRISLFFSRPDMNLKEWIITDAQGLDTRIQVSNLEQNKRVSAELFEFSKEIGFQRE